MNVLLDETLEAYKNGNRAGADENQALAYYKIAADAGHVEAQVKTGLLYKSKGNNVEAMRYLIAAAYNNSAQAQALITYVSNMADSNP
ncbi:MAG: hypothetical protein PHW94_08015 [Sulfurimonas sp.]|nr:hypothetical protein [Sulfurimonas sp.]